VTSKEALLAAALDEALDGLHAAIEGAISETSADAGERLRLAVRRSVEVLVAHQPAVTLLLRVRGNSPVEVAALERRRQLDERLAVLVRAAVDEGSLRADLDPELVSRLVFGTVNSLVEWYRPDGALDPVHLADAVVDLACEGLRAD
jgi:AcrR family transcriptional regulator